MKAKWVVLGLVLAVGNCMGGTPAFAEGETITYNELLRQYTIQNSQGDRVGVIKKRPMNKDQYVIEDTHGNRTNVIKCDKWWCEKEDRKKENKR